MLTPNEGRPIGSTMANIQKQKKRGRNFKRHSLPRCRRKMLLSHIEVCFQGSVLAFKDIPSFATWVQSVEGSSKIIGIRGVGEQQGQGDPLLSHFVTLELHLQGPPGCWQRQRIGYLHKLCGHCPIEREAVMSEAEGYKCDPRAKGERLCRSQRSSLDLPLLPIQQQPLSPVLSASDGTATSLSSLE